MDEKKALQSKTIITNSVGLIAAGGILAGVDLGMDMDSQTAIVAGIMAILNIILRFMTKGPEKVK